MNHNFWRGEKVRLRAIEQKDLDAVMNPTEEPDTELDRFEDFIRFPVSKEKDRESLAALGKRETTGDSFFGMIEDLQGNHVGYINTFDCERRPGTFKYAIIIKRSYWSQGYAREAVTLVLRYYLRELRYQKVTVLVYSFNERSMRFHEKMGFKFEGRLRRMVYTNGEYYDEIYYGMTSEEFNQYDPQLDLKRFTENR